VVLLLGGVFSMAYAAGALISSVATGELREFLWRRRLESTLSAMRDHFIVCGYGRMGRLVCEEFARLKMPFVVVELSEAHLRDFALARGNAIVGDASSDAVLRRAGVERARALITVVASDADNLYITMSARLMNDKLFIVARAEEEAATEKLQRAGANKVVSPYVIGGHRVAQAVLRPAVLDFIELATRAEHLELQMEETTVGRASWLVGKSMEELTPRSALGILIVAIRKPSGGMVFNPEPHVRLDADDILISLGPRDRLDKLESLARPG
jgi:voltage-gated potassium channel